MRQEKGLIVLTSILTLVPLFVGLLLWRRLPQQIPVHFGMHGQADGWGSKGAVVFGLSFFLLAAHLFSIWCALRDPKNGAVHPKLNRLVLLIAPVTAVLLSLIIYPMALQADLEYNVTTLSFVLSGLLFVLFGNYMPKCRPNHTIGIRIKWTLEDEEIWMRTHRFAGPLWVIGGLVILLDAFAQIAFEWVFLATISFLTVVPILYSYVLYRRKHG